MRLSNDPKIVLKQARDIKEAIELLERALNLLLEHNAPISGTLAEIQYAKYILERLR